MISVAVGVLASSLQAVDAQTHARRHRRGPVADDDGHSRTLSGAQRFFYNADYDKAAALTRALRGARLDNLEACELRTSQPALSDREGVRRNRRARRGDCLEPMRRLSWTDVRFLAETARGQAFAREKRKTDPEDEATLFFLGKVDLNYLWLQLGTLGRVSRARGSITSVGRRCQGVLAGSSRREREAWTSCRPRGGRNRRRRLLRAQRSDVCPMGHAGARTGRP
jgi:hypothetical protein